MKKKKNQKVFHTEKREKTKQNKKTRKNIK